jgi:iron complex outermembrane recepter protein
MTRSVSMKALGCKALGCIAVAAGLGMGVAPAAAQTPQPVIDELIVTAQKREERLQEVAGSVSAIGREALLTRGIDSVQDLQFQTPNFQAGTSFSSTIIFIRGVGQMFVGQPGVATHIDGVYQSRIANVALSQVDLARIEVLRGPQGTLYGRNATAGAVNFITNAPSDRQEGYARVGYADYDEVTVQGVMNMPVTDRVRSRLVLDYRDQRDGFVRNVVPGNPEMGATKGLSGRLRTQFDIAESGMLDVVLFGHRTEGPADYLVPSNVPAPTSVGNNPYLADVIVPLRPHRTSANLPSRREADTLGATSTFTWFFGETLLRSVTGYYEYEYNNAFDADGTQVDLVAGDNDLDSRTFTQELTFSGQAGAFDWLVGAYLMDDKFESVTNYAFPLGLNVPSIGIAVVPGGGFSTQAVPFEARTYAAFADGTWRTNDRLRFLAGARYSWEKQDNFQTNQSGPLQTPFGLIPIFRSCHLNHVPLKFESFTPRAGVQYDLDDAASKNVYFLVSRGFKAGGLNQSGCNNSYNPEKLLAYEAGVKGLLLDGELSFNMAAFYYDYSDFQLNQIRGLSASIVNAPEATVRGLEIETVWSPDPHWTLNANLALLDSTYGRLVNVDGLYPERGDQNLNGNRLNYSPRASGNIGVQYATMPMDWGRLAARAEVYLTSRFYFREFNQPEDGQSGYSLLNLALIWRSSDERFMARAYANNATDRAYLSTMGVSDNTGSRFVNWGPPRRLGFEVSASF